MLKHPRNDEAYFLDLVRTVSHGIFDEHEAAEQKLAQVKANLIALGYKDDSLFKLDYARRDEIQAMHPHDCAINWSLMLSPKIKTLVSKEQKTEEIER